jgi:hypothetical protein
MMNYYRLRPALNAAQSTPIILKWGFITILILFLAYTTVSSSPDLVQGHEDTLRQHEIIYNLDPGPPSDQLTKAMNAMLHHLPPRREILSTAPEDCDPRFHISAYSKKCTEISTDGVSQSHGNTDARLHKRQTFKADVRRSESVDDDRVRSLVLRSNNAQQMKNDIERLVGLLGPSKCHCDPHKPSCHCPHPNAPSVELIPAGMDGESPTASDFRELEVSSKPTNRESNQKEVKDQWKTYSEIENDKDRDEGHKLEKLSTSPKSTTCSCEPNYPECQCAQHLALHGNEKKDVSQPSDIKGHHTSPDLKEKNPCRREEYDGDHQCNCPICTGALSNWKETSTLSDVRDLADSQKLADYLAVIPPKCSCSPQNTKCPCRDQKPHTVIHESQSDQAATLAPSGVKAGQISGLTKSDPNGETPEHTPEVNNYSKLLLEGLNLTIHDHIHVKPSIPTGSVVTARRNWCSNKWWRGRRYCQDKHNHITQVKSHDHVPVEPEPIPDTTIAKRSRPCHRNACRPAQSNMPELKTVAPPDHLLRHNDTLVDSITHSRCHGKEGMDREICENNNRTGFWVVCTFLILVGICGILLVLLTFLTRLRRKRPSPLLLNSGTEHKSGASTQSTSVSEIQFPRVGRPPPCVMRRIDEDENDEAGSVRRYTTLDGVNDGWTKWILQKQKRSKKVSFCLTIKLSVPLATHQLGMNKLIHYARSANANQVDFPQRQ